MSPSRIRGSQASGSIRPLAALPLTLAAITLALMLLPSASPTADRVAPPNFFGVDLNSGPVDFAQMADANVGVARTVFPFGVLKQERHEPYYWGYSDQIVQGAADNNIVLIPILYGAPPWISTDLNHTPLHGQSKRAWNDFLVAIVQRYGPGGQFWAENPYVPYHPIDTWQIWNEPNSITWWGPRPKPREYAQLLRRSAAAIHSVHPYARIMSAGVVARPTNRHAIPGRKYLASLFAIRGVAQTVDAVGYHPFAPSAPGVKRQLRAARQVLRQRHAGATPIWITEIGWGSKGPRKHPLIKSPGGQNRALRDTFEMVLAMRAKLGLAGLLWYQWRDGPDDLCLWCETSGLVGENAQPKRLLSTFASIAKR